MVATLDTGQRSHPGGWAGEHLAKEGELSIPPLCSLLPELLCWSLCQSWSSCRQYVPGGTERQESQDSRSGDCGWEGRQQQQQAEVQSHKLQ